MSERLRIGVVVSSATDGGGEHYLRVLQGGLASRGHQPVLFGDLPSWDLQSVPTGVEGKWSRATLWRDGTRAAVERQTILRVVREQHRLEPFDLFHLQYKREQVLLTGALARLAPVVWTEHGIFPDGRGTGLLRACYRRAGRSVDHVVCVSDAVEDGIAPLLGPSTATTVIPNSVDLGRHRPALPRERTEARLRFGIRPEGRVLVTASRLHRAKGVDAAIEATDHLPRNWVLAVAGDGPDRQRLEMLARERPVVFTGHLTDVAPLFQAADVFLLPSTREAKEGNPIALLEAAAHGLPIVATRDAGIDSQIEAAGGLLTVRDPSSIAAAVTKAVRAHRGLIAAAWAQRHGLSRWLDDYEELLTRLAA